VAQTLTAFADRYYHAGEYPQTITVATAALTLDRQAALAVFYRGMAYDGLGNRRQAIEDLRRAAHLGVAPASEILRAWGTD
jgi:regulator of sirC expression with transglutaminase-like and TPR domain